MFEVKLACMSHVSYTDINESCVECSMLWALCVWVMSLIMTHMSDVSSHVSNAVCFGGYHVYTGALPCVSMHAACKYSSAGVIVSYMCVVSLACVSNTAAQGSLSTHWMESLKRLRTVGQWQEKQNFDEATMSRSSYVKCQLWQVPTSASANSELFHVVPRFTRRMPKL